MKAIRAGMWFRALPRIDRVLIDLTIKVADSVRSLTLARSIEAIIGKLKRFLEINIFHPFREKAFRLAKKLGALAQNWGNLTAKNWFSDASFIKFLSVMYANQPNQFKTNFQSKTEL